MSRAQSEKTVDRPTLDLFLLFSILLLILVHPVLDVTIWGRALLSLLTFAPLVIAMLRMSQKKGLFWPFAALIGGTLACALAAYITDSHALLALQWALATIGFAVSVAGLFTYLQAGTETRITPGHLYTAGSIYLLLVLMFFALYSGIAAVLPDAFQKTAGGPSNEAADLLYFSMVTLTTVGYGDIVPARGIVRMLAGLEATTGVLYVAITVSLLVSGYKGKARS